ncbi:MAG: hypothetical protein JWP35_437 [Caulobacter sp.]|nr:hypothetical protein [Caulobacter sp.]
MIPDPDRLAADLDARGFALTGPLFTPAECAELAALYGCDPLFRKTVIMGSHDYGQGEYRYFAYPLPDPVQRLREALYPTLAQTANRWAERLGQATRFPEQHAKFLERCHAAGQTKPTPLMLTYGPGDYNRLHQDLYGEHVFPLQAVILLNDPATDFEGGQLVLVENKPRSQSRAEVLDLRQGEAAIFAVRDFPGASPRGYARRQLRHGVSTMKSGQRRTLGIIFHDAG